MREVMMLGRAPLHFAVRVRGPAGSAGGGSRLSLVLSQAEYQALRARGAEFEAANRVRPGKPRR